MNIRYQVFISSTFTDLKVERSAVIQTLMEMDCIPAGMELFPAMDEEQWKFIQRIIDDCDYYILILGGRYGSLSPDGVSYTEKEYDYALARGLKVLAFIHSEPDSLPAKFTDADTTLKTKLDAFRVRVSTGRLVKFWTDTKEIPGLVALSMNKTIKTYPAVGWVRADSVASEQLLSEMNELRKINQKLHLDLTAKAHSDETERRLASVDEVFDVKIKYHVQNGEKSAEVSVTWRELFAQIAPYLQRIPSDGGVNFKLAAGLLRKQWPNHGYTPTVPEDDFETVRVQLIALGLIRVDYAASTKGDMILFWHLTQKGADMMFKWRTVETSNKDNVDTSDAEVIDTTNPS